MKISRISQALGSISDEFSREAIEEFDTKSAKINNTVPEKPRVIREEKSRKTPFVIALAGLCAAAAIAVPLVLKNVEKNALLSGAASSAAVEKLGYDLDGSEDYREYKFEFTMPEYEGVDFECTHYQITANGEVIASGMPILQVYLADLNGDGRREIVCYTGCSGNMSNVINVCDYSEKQLYILFSRGIESWLDLFENNGELWVRESEYRTKNVLSEKKLEISDMKKIDGSFENAKAEKIFDNDNFKSNVSEDDISFTVPEFADVSFEWTRQKVTANGETIAEGMYIYQVYLADLNGDGLREIVTSSSWSSAFAPESIGIYDYANRRFYVMHTSDYFNTLSLYINNNELWVREKDYLGNNVLRDKKLEMSDVKLYKNGPEVSADEMYSGFEPELSDDISIAVNAEKVRLYVNGGKLSAVSDKENPNVNIFSIKFDTAKAENFAFVINEDGTYQTFSGDNLSKEEILRKCPAAAFGLMWQYKNGGDEVSALLENDKIHAFNASHDSSKGTLRTYEYWFALDSEIARSFEEFTQEGCSGGIRLKDNGNGTYSMITAPYNSEEVSEFPTSDDISAILENVRNSLIEKTSLSADEAKYYVQNYACYDLDFDGEAEVLVVNTFGSPAVHVFERNGTTYEESSVFPMKALEYTGYKLELNPYQNGDERYYYFRFFSGGGTMEADVLGAIKQTESGYEMEYLYSWGTLDYKGIPEPVKKEFYRKGWDKYDLALADSNPNDIPKEELAAILKNYGITLN